MTDDASVTSKQSKMSLLKRMGSFNKSAEDQEQNVFVLFMKDDKKMELMCSCQGEVAEWVGALRQAIALGGATGGTLPAVMMAAPEAAARPLATAAAGGQAPAGGGYPTSNRPPLPVAPRSAAGEPEQPAKLAAIAEPAGQEEGATAPAEAEAEEEGEKPQAARTGFLDFEAIEEEVRPGEEAKEVEAAETTEVSTTNLATMQ